MTGPIVQRRRLLGVTAALALATKATAAEAPTPFNGQTVRALARTLAQSPYKPPSAKLPDAFSNLDYDAYRKIRFDPNQALWRGASLPFQAQFFHRGFLFGPKMDIYEVVNGEARPIVYRPELFDFGPDLKPPAEDLGFAGFRIHAPINRPDYFDEVAVFLGASYFRAVGRNQGYGLSSRGLSLKTADPGGEEFPIFRAFYLERPQPGTNSLVLTGLLDSPSATGAMRVTLRPGEDTTMDCELTLYPRTDLHAAGIAAGTSMFLYDSTNRTAFDDWRRAVHDSDGLMMRTGRNEHLWRPLANPRTLQISSFVDASPRGFGLMQRKRGLADYQDLEARYGRRPSLWVEPIGDWGEGVVQLVEIPTREEIHDNIVAFWRPKQPFTAKGEHNITYRLHWCETAPGQSDLARVHRTMSGAIPNGRVYVIDFSGEDIAKLQANPAIKAAVSASPGTVQNVNAIPDPEQGGWRISFDMQPGDAKLVELRATLMHDDTPLSETWIYRWTA